MFKTAIAAFGFLALSSGAAFADGCATTSSESISFGDNIAEAVAIGDDCANSVALIIVRDGDGAPLYSHATPARYLFGFYEVTDERSMADFLDELIGVRIGGGAFTSSELPEWPEGADFPGGDFMSGEFPFYPEEWVDRGEYLRFQSMDAPVWCHVQGQESSACLIIDGDRLYKIGVQTFPG